MTKKKKTILIAAGRFQPYELVIKPKYGAPEIALPESFVVEITEISAPDSDAKDTETH